MSEGKVNIVSKCKKDMRCVKDLEEYNKEQGAYAGIWCISDGNVCPHLMLGLMIEKCEEDKE